MIRFLPIRVLLRGALVGALSFAVLPVAAQSAVDAYKVMGLKPTSVLSGTTLNAAVVPSSGKQLVTITTYMTGKRDRENAVGVRLDVFRVAGKQLEPIYQRDFAAESDAAVSDGNLQLVDLDRDGINEIIVSWRNFADPLIDQRLGEVIVYEEGGFRTGWAGAFEYDATRAARNVPQERRDRYVRDVAIAATLRTRGVTLFMTKTVIAVAGVRLEQPKIVQEAFPLRPRNTW